MQQKKEVKATTSPLYTVRETCELLRCKRNKLLSLRQAGKIKAIISGRIVLFPEAMINEYINNNKEGSNHE